MSPIIQRERGWLYNEEQNGLGIISRVQLYEMCGGAKRRERRSRLYLRNDIVFTNIMIQFKGELWKQMVM